MKNYFTNEQVNELAWDNCSATHRRIDNKLSFHLTEDQIKTLMNLAVEAAIGQPVASQVPRLIDLSKSTNVHFSRTKEGMHLTDDELKESINGTVAKSLFPLYEAGYYVEDKHGAKHYSTPLYSVKEFED